MNETHNSNSDSTENREPEPAPETLQVSLGDFLAFRSFAMPFLIQFVFWLGTLAFFFWGVGIIQAADHPWQPTNQAMVWAGLGVMVLGPAILRIAGELVMVVFRIHEGIQAMARRQS